MKTDRELLELAAKAAGAEVLSGRWVALRDDGVWHFWNPLEDDGDALRLAIDANVRFGLVLEDSRGYAEGENVYIEFEWDMHRPSDRYEAVRRAIVRAAAEIVATKET
jgi:hypothetical protein